MTLVMPSRHFPPLLAALILLPALLAANELRLASPFTHHMVVQRDRPIAVWGSAPAGREVTVTLGASSAKATTDHDGQWRLDLPALPANAEPQTLVASASNLPDVSLEDVLVGEVWLASGQSNMQWTVDRCREEDKTSAREHARGTIRFFTVPLKVAAYRQDAVEGAWTTATPESVMRYSGAAWFFADALQRELGVPVGIISSSWGGSRIEPWTTLDGFASVQELAWLHRHRIPRTPGTADHRQVQREHVKAVGQWVRQSRELLKGDRPLPPLPTPPESLAIGHNQEIGLYQAMIHPFVPYSLRGFLWYQGESNLNDGLAYHHKMQALIRGWRQAWNLPEAPFLYAQLAPFNYGQDAGDKLPRIWAAQLKTLDEPHTGMAVLTDIGNPGDIHPQNKSDVGNRLALWALAGTYGRELVYSGPLFEKATRDGARLRVEFAHRGEGLRTRDGQAPSHFEIAGADGHFKPATAEVTAEGAAVMVSHPEISEPEQVRFSWDGVANPNLVNSAGLPASPFHSHWPVDPDLGNNVAIGKPYTTSDPNPWGWEDGLTDGSWAGEKGACFATRNSPAFPKHVTVDLGKSYPLTAIRCGVPDFGSTHRIAVLTSADGKDFREAGTHQFAQGAEEVATIPVDNREARYVRVSFLENHQRDERFDRNFAFLTELEVYAGTGN